ncbi:MAG TPA: histidine kinase [Flavitalea sp.]|nr:histidine kinase [Flavitalea sp.]
MSLYCFLPACVVSLYLALYVIWPFFLKKKKYLRAFYAMVAVFFIDICLNYFFSLLFFSNYYIRSQTLTFGGELAKFSGTLQLAYQNSVWAITSMGLGLAIKLSKNCYLQQRENLEIVRKKLRNEINLQKSRLQPIYLRGSLDSIEAYVNAGSEKGCQMILKLSDVLNYTLYECEVELIPIQTELSAIGDFIELEKLKNNGDDQIRLSVHSELDGLVIPPTLLLTFLQELADILNEGPRKAYEANIMISRSPGRLNIKTSIYSLDEDHKEFPDFSMLIERTRNRLASIASSDNFEIDIRIGPDECMISFSFIHGSEERLPRPLIVNTMEEVLPHENK